MSEDAGEEREGDNSEEFHGCDRVIGRDGMKGTRAEGRTKSSILSRENFETNRST